MKQEVIIRLVIEFLSDDHYSRYLARHKVHTYLKAILFRYYNNSSQFIVAFTCFYSKIKIICYLFFPMNIIQIR